MTNQLSKANPARYDQAAASYGEGRLPYSKKLIEHAVAAAGVDRNSTVLDLGCGPGTIANEIAKYCGKVIAVDPSEAMLEAGWANAPDNVTYIQGSSDDLSFIKEPVQLVTFGRSFHWMDRVATLEKLDQLVAPDGALAFLYVAPLSGATKAHRWYYAVRRAAKLVSDLNLSEDKPLDANAEREEFVLLRSAFSDVSMYGHYEFTDWSFDRVAAWLLSRYSTGSTAADADKRKFEVAAMVTKALEPYGDGPWRTMNQQRIIVSKRPE